jgi:DNA-binding IclR family transcriptional regulator
MSELAKAPQTGLSYDIDEQSSEDSIIGFAFADWSGDLHSISAPFPSTRDAEIRTSVDAALRSTAKHVQELIIQNGRQSPTA